MKIKVLYLKSLFKKNIKIDIILKDVVIIIGHSNYFELRKDPTKEYRKIYYNMFIKELIEYDAIDKINELRSANDVVISNKDLDFFIKYIKDKKLLLYNYEILRGKNIENFLINRFK